MAYDEETVAHHWRHENEHGMPSFESWYTFDDADGKTTVTTKVEYTVPGSFLGKALDKLFVERQNAKDVE